ncbi:MAG: prepilin peptidase [Coprococcus sp.]
MIIYIGIAVIYDFKTWRIPNMFVVCGMAAGAAASMITRGIVRGVECSIAGIVIPVAALFILFILKTVGGGDIKLFAAIGSFAGTDIGYIMLYSFIAGGILSFIYLIRLIIKSITGRNKKSENNSENSLTIRKMLKSKIHFSLAVFIGTVCYVVFMAGGGY